MADTPPLSTPIGALGCFNERMTLAGSYVREGDWGSGHVIARSLLRCANSSGCRSRDECHGAALSLLSEIMRAVSG